MTLVFILMLLPGLATIALGQYLLFVLHGMGAYVVGPLLSFAGVALLGLAIVPYKKVSVYFFAFLVLFVLSILSLVYFYNGIPDYVFR